MASQEKKDNAPEAAAKGKQKGKQSKEVKKPLTPLALLEHNCSLLKREPLERRFVTRALRKLNIVRCGGRFLKSRELKKKGEKKSSSERKHG